MSFIMELNTLISTFITSTAALVAIIGGFLVSRVITLSSEKNTISRRLQEITNDLSAKNKLLEKVELEILEDDIDDFIYNNCEDIIIKGKKIEKILREYDSNNLSIDEITPYIDELFKITDEIMKLIEKASSLPEDFTKFLSENNYAIAENKDWHELVYKTIWNQLPDDSSHRSLLGFNIPKITPPDIIHRYNIVDQQFHRDRIKGRNRLTNEIHILELRKEEQIKILNDYGRPSGIWGVLFVLFYAFIVGIAYPSMLLSYPKNLYNDVLTKWFLLSLFFSHLIILFIYLAISMYKLTKNNYHK